MMMMRILVPCGDHSDDSDEDGDITLIRVTIIRKDSLQISLFTFHLIRLTNCHHDNPQERRISSDLGCSSSAPSPFTPRYNSKILNNYQEQQSDQTYQDNQAGSNFLFSPSTATARVDLPASSLLQGFDCHHYRCRPPHHHHCNCCHHR